MQGNFKKKKLEIYNANFPSKQDKCNSFVKYIFTYDHMSDE